MVFTEDWKMKAVTPDNLFSPQGRKCVLKDCCAIADNTYLPPETVVPPFTLVAGSPGW